MKAKLQQKTVVQGEFAYKFVYSKLTLNRIFQFQEKHQENYQMH